MAFVSRLTNQLANRGIDNFSNQWFETAGHQNVLLSVIFLIGLLQWSKLHHCMQTQCDRISKEIRGFLLSIKKATSVSSRSH